MVELSMRILLLGWLLSEVIHGVVGFCFAERGGKNINLVLSGCWIQFSSLQPLAVFLYETVTLPLDFPSLSSISSLCLPDKLCLYLEDSRFVSHYHLLTFLMRFWLTRV